MNRNQKRREDQPDLLWTWLAMIRANAPAASEHTKLARASASLQCMIVGGAGGFVKQLYYAGLERTIHSYSSMPSWSVVEGANEPTAAIFGGAIVTRRRISCFGSTMKGMRELCEYEDYASKYGSCTYRQRHSVHLPRWVSEHDASGVRAMNGTHFYSRGAIASFAH